MKLQHPKSVSRLQQELEETRAQLETVIGERDDAIARAWAAEERVLILENDIEMEQRCSIEWSNVIRKIAGLVGIPFYTLGQSRDVIKAVSALKRGVGAETFIEIGPGQRDVEDEVE